ncbi:GNAT family N-acetyltransferase [Frigidibacter sp. ROC022]|uniref:GNAT family N-acetyltransferase n=1 Tax=Frigidibacter sp. ROC022 TaxID=2971796 RepID=UPI00215A343C|nr:GNAT family N-acyltransferase [Frigidibacter sp. ROC022]MCR8723931.1 GNAT family N-acetyltransferase [Frigidibacter sp. ROC022]
MDIPAARFETRLARDASDIAAAQRLRYRVFVAELGGGGPGVDHARGLETDAFDPYCEHLLLFDRARDGDQVVGVYRLLDGPGAARVGHFYSEGEYDLTPLKRSGRRLLELGRSCLDKRYRGGAGMMHLWMALADVVQQRGIEILFGVASFHGTDVAAMAEPLAQLRQAHLAPEEIRPRSLVYQSMDLWPPEKINRTRAMLAVPALIKAYLRLGGHVGDGAFVDHAFNTIDVCLVLDTARMTERQRTRYSRGLHNI